MKISIVMTTYNGEKYLIEQLDSLRDQTRKPDEVIICDDGSSDSTNRYIDKYIEENNLENWKHIINEENKGWKKNFIDGIKMSTGDLIFTCDQDDVWYKYKLELMEEIMAQKPEISLLYSTYDLEKNDEAAKPAKVGIKRYRFKRDFMFVRSPGCVFCFRRGFFDDIKDMWYEDYPHDALLWRYAMLTDSLYMVCTPLIYYRRHEDTATGHENRTAQSKIQSMGYYTEALDRLEKYIKAHPECAEGEKAYKKDYIKKCRAWCQLRTEFLKTRKLNLWRKLGRYMDYYFNPKSYFADLYMAFRDKNK